MIVIDTSAMMAIIQGEQEAPACKVVLSVNDTIMISAATLTEAMIVASRRGLAAKMAELIESMEIEVIPLTQTAALRAADAYRQWGKRLPPGIAEFR